MTKPTRQQYYDDIPPFIEVEETRDGKVVRVNPHLGQYLSLQSEKRFVVALGGTQSGKSVTGAYWLYREMQRRAKMLRNPEAVKRGAKPRYWGIGDWLVVAPHIGILEKKALKEFRHLFETLLNLGKYVGGDKKYFVFSRDGMIRTFGEEYANETCYVYFGHAKNANTLEAATAYGAWLDEAGQSEFTEEAWEAIQRRLSIAEGRVYISTTPYGDGWFREQFWDEWVAHDRNHPDIDIIQFKSIMNPVFPRSEWERAKRTLPPWKFKLFYEAEFTRPAGLIYDVFDREKHVSPQREVPEGARVALGLDFGGTNFACVMAFLNEDERWEIFDVYEAGNLSAAEHAKNIKARLNAKITGSYSLVGAWGGAGGEKQWRTELTLGGLTTLKPPVSGSGSVEIGIGLVYSGLVENDVCVQAHLTNLIRDFERYRYETDAEGNAFEDKIYNKNAWHRMDALRYLFVGVKSRDINIPTPVIKKRWRSDRRGVRTVTPGKLRVPKIGAPKNIPWALRD